LVGSNQGILSENATACSKRMLKTRVATQLYLLILIYWIVSILAVPKYLGI